jgi:hypothetical protein
LSSGAGATLNEGWSDFFVAQVGAAAALSGLVIVAVSINRAPGGKRRVDPASADAPARRRDHCCRIGDPVSTIVFQIRSFLAIKNQPLNGGCLAPWSAWWWCCPC